MKAYKIFEFDWKCRDFQFLDPNTPEGAGKVYEYNGNLEIRKSGFHACLKLEDCFRYYQSVSWNHIAEVELLGDIISHDTDSKKCTNRLKIIREIKWGELNGISESYGISESRGISGSKGISGSYGISWSNGISRSNGISGSRGISESSFCHAIDNRFYFFNKKLPPKRYNAMVRKLDELLNGWSPKFNNLHALYLKSGSQWELTPIPQAQHIQKADAWADMPIEAIDYLASLPEYNERIFFNVTGIKRKKTFKRRKDNDKHKNQAQKTKKR